ncbi:SH3 domain-containing protein [Streptomyces sp. NBC_01092]|uniref:SH3 domain-containing protein n=1 Tax=Streptomyces sp. NBC_01092 TaxID=2903748 RepID=UPI003869CD72|nr:SH3 domain-containing protein [Streptomyces sp. NBC_01092]
MSTDRVEEAERADETGGGTAPAVTTLAASANALRYYSVAPGVRLNVRRGPGTGYALVRTLPEGARIPIYCQTPGTNVSGPYGTSNIWDNIADSEYVADAYVQTGSDGYVRPRCS